MKKSELNYKVDIFEDTDRTRLMKIILNSLPAVEKRILLLYAEAGSASGASRLLQGVTERTYRNYVSRIRSKAQKLLKQYSHE